MRSNTDGPLPAALRIGGIYLLAGSVWILASDWIAYRMFDPEWNLWLQVFKGLLYVLTSAALVAGLVFQRFRAVRKVHEEILERLARAGAYRDDDTGRHVHRVGETAERIARKMGLPDAFCRRLHDAAPLHDIGKIGVSDTILNKTGRLTPEEYETMKEHARIGGRILGGSEVPLLRMAERIAMTHHERWDGSGYPRGLAGEAIPMEGRIVAVADVFDALVGRRPYKEPWPPERAVEEIRSQRGRQFDAAVVDAFLACMTEGEIRGAAEPEGPSESTPPS